MPHSQPAHLQRQGSVVLAAQPGGQSTFSQRDCTQWTQHFEALAQSIFIEVRLPPPGQEASLHSTLQEDPGPQVMSL
jgi:hypothetical protein